MNNHSNHSRKFIQRTALVLLCAVFFMSSYNTAFAQFGFIKKAVGKLGFPISGPADLDQLRSLESSVQACEAATAGELSSAFSQAEKLAKFASLSNPATALFASGAFGGNSDPKLDEICKAMKTQLTVAKNQIRKEQREKFQKSLGAVAFKKGLDIFFRKLAYDTAMKVASALPGGKPAVETRKWKDILGQAGDDAIGEFLNVALKDVWGTSLCEPASPFIKLRIELLARSILQPQRPSCRFSEILRAANQTGRDPVTGKRTLNNFLDIPNITDPRDIRDYFRPGSNDLGALITIVTTANANKAQAEAEAHFDATLGQGFRNIGSTISGYIRTPSSVVRSLTDQLYVGSAWRPYVAYTGDVIADAFGVFTDTLAARVIEQTLFKGLAPAPTDYAKLKSLFSVGINPIAAAAEKFAKILESADVKGGGDIQLLQELTYIDGQPCQENPAPNYAVIDDQLRVAIESRISVRQAILLGRLDQNRPFARKQGGIGATRNVCQEKGVYSLRSIEILAKYRIIPSTWVAAAKYIIQFGEDRDYTLKELIAAYNDRTSPFYRLVDPEWILVAPGHKARREGFGRITSAGVTTRNGKVVGLRDIEREDLAIDEQSCIFVNPANPNECLHYGYCMVDRPVIRLQGTQCNPWNASCTTVRQRTGEVFSYLLNTIRYDQCAEPGAVGCRSYCTVLNEASSDWQCAEPGFVYRTCQQNECACTAPNGGGACLIASGDFSCVTPEGVFCTLGMDPASGGSTDPAFMYINSTALTCSEEGAGCSEFIRFRDPKSNILYDENQTAAVLAAMNDTDTIDAYFTANVDGVQPQAEVVYVKRTNAQCVQDDLGCELYTPSNGDPAVPGIVDAAGLCFAECSGFRRYQIFPSFFDSNPSPTEYDFIAASPTEFCSASADGCEAFTNQRTSQEEAFSKLRTCIPPGTGTAEERVYYTWEGFEETGYQLKEWVLVADGTGATPPPCTQPNLNGTCGNTSIPEGVCGPETPDSSDDQEVNPDCRQFYIADPSGAVQSYWRLQSRLSLVSESCTPFRRAVDNAVWFGLPDDPETRSCSVSEVGCRQFKGVNAANIRYVPLGSGQNIETFESGSTAIDPNSGSLVGWSVNASALSARSLFLGGRSLLATQLLTTTSDLDLKKGAVYELSFWALGGSSTSISAALKGTTPGFVAPFDLGGVSLSPTEWQYIRVTLSGNGYLNITQEPGNEAFLEFSSSGSFSIDNIALRETPDSVYVIRNSWDIDQMKYCSDNNQLGCMEYADSLQNKVYIKNFSRLCTEEVIGCSPVIDTHNSNRIGSEEFNKRCSGGPNDGAQCSTDAQCTGGTCAGGTDTVVVPRDALAYMVVNSQTQCDSSQVGCRLLGEGRYTPQGIRAYDTKALVVDPDNYTTILCLAEHEFCDSFTPEGGSGGLLRFKDPQGRVCEFKTNITDTEGTYYQGAWFIQGTLEPCPTYTIAETTPLEQVTGHCLGGWSVKNKDADTVENRNKCHSSAECTNNFFPGSLGTCSQYTGVCSSDNHTCTEFQNPQNPELCDSSLLYGESERVCFGGSAQGTPCLQNSDCAGNGSCQVKSTCVGGINAGAMCFSSTDCTSGVCQRNTRGEYCDYYYYLSSTIDGANQCNGLNPSAGCVGLFNTTSGQPKTYLTEKVCLSSGQPVNTSGTVCTFPGAGCGISCYDSGDCPNGTTCDYLKR